jgi:pyruvate-ferredoxin/flavodoxin oxidoreductase
MTVSHLRFGPRRIRAPYLVERAQFVACHQFSFLERFDVLRQAQRGATFLLNSPYGPDEIWDQLPVEVQQEILAKELRLFVIDGDQVARESGMGRRVNTVMQTCFFAISGVLPRDEAIEAIKHSIKKTYGKRGEAVVQQNYRAVDMTLERLYEVNLAGVAVPQAVGVPIPAGSTNGNGHAPLGSTIRLESGIRRRPAVPEAAPEFVKNVLGPMMTFDGDRLPVSALPADGTYPVGTSQWEKRNIALEIPVWDADLCIQCGKCAYVCPHAVIRTKVYQPEALAGAPESFLSSPARFKEFPGASYTLAVSPEDCTGCSLCVEICPVKDKKQVGRKAINMEAQPPIREREAANWEFFRRIPDVERTAVSLGSIKNSQLMVPLFEFSGACSGCGETPYIKLLTQLYGDRALIANATGCSSIYGGNLPTTPYTADSSGRGPAWSNSLFEDNAEFGLGMRLALDHQAEHARELLPLFGPAVGQELVDAILGADQSTEQGIAAQRERVAELKRRLHTLDRSKLPQVVAREHELLAVADTLVKKSVWIVGGDGWAYDIGYGGLDHVLASGRNVNVLVLDTEVYSNTGGQASKSTPRGAVAKFAANGKAAPKKDLGMIAMAYGSIYVARVAMGADDVQTLRAFMEAEAYDGPSLIIAYSHCIAHGIDMKRGLDQQKLAVQTGHWPLYRYNPDLPAQGKGPLTIDSKAPSVPLEQYTYNETRYRMLRQSNPERAAELLDHAQQEANARWERHQQLAAMMAAKAAAETN